MGVTVSVQLPFSIFVLGLVTGLIVPLVSNFYPIKQALGTSLRNALDRFRQGVDELQVQFVRMENAGTSPTQMAIAITFIIASFLTLFLIPKSIIDGSVKLIFLYLNMLLIGCVIGIVFVSQSLAMFLCKCFINIILFFMP